MTSLDKTPEVENDMLTVNQMLESNGENEGGQCDPEVLLQFENKYGKIAAR